MRVASMVFGGLALVVGSALAQGTAPQPNVRLVSGSGVVFAANVDREEAQDLGSTVASAETLREGLFPEDQESAEQRKDRERCERLIAEGFKCMPPARKYVRYNLPGASFRIGSAELPDLMKQQLRTFADALRGKSAPGPVIRIDGHADASGSAQDNLVLSQKRAASVREYLVSLGVASGLLSIEGHGDRDLRNRADPTAAENRRVEIARVLPK